LQGYEGTQSTVHRQAQLAIVLPLKIIMPLLSSLLPSLKSKLLICVGLLFETNAFMELIQRLKGYIVFLQKAL